MNLSESFLSTSEKHTEEITDYFSGRLTGGFAEGLNNKIMVIRRRCYGIFDVRHLFQRISLTWKDIPYSDVGERYDRLLPRKLPESQNIFLNLMAFGVSPRAYPCSQGNMGLPLQNMKKFADGYLSEFEEQHN